MTRRRARPAERVSLDVVYVILLAFAALLGLAGLVWLGVLGVAVGDIQSLLQSLNLALNQPNSATDAVHFAIGFTLGLATYIAATSTGARRIRVLEEDTRASSRAGWTIVGVTVAATALILLKEFWFDPTFEGATLVSGEIDLLTYALGLAAALGAGFALERP
ncbi:MAG TPA: hypothetical protein VGV89_10365 [Thermoplasmata archaeon]|nr:hypothetical protein [Thermoplasmata archaeon]